jgi:hypothetical protein
MHERPEVEVRQIGDWIAMVTAMGIEKHAAFYRGYQPGDRSPLPVAIVLATLIALWLLVYLVSAVGPQPGAAGVRPPSHPARAVSLPSAR